MSYVMSKMVGILLSGISCLLKVTGGCRLGLCVWVYKGD